MNHHFPGMYNPETFPPRKHGRDKDSEEGAPPTKAAHHEHETRLNEKVKATT